jgi:hypothetical protein
MRFTPATNCSPRTANAPAASPLTCRVLAFALRTTSALILRFIKKVGFLGVNLPRGAFLPCDDGGAHGPNWPTEGGTGTDRGTT